MMTEFTLFTTLALHHLIIGGVLTIILLALGRIIKTSAEMRSWIWMTVFLAATLIPFSLFNPENALTSKVNSEFMTSQTLVTSNQPTIIIDESKDTSPDWHVPSELVYTFQQFLTLFMFIWLGGSLWRCVSVLRSFVRTQQLIKSCKPLPLEHSLQTEINKKSRAGLFTSNSVSSPLVTGLISPKIILPENIINQLDHKQLAPIVLHELAHVQRFDVLFVV